MQFCTASQVIEFTSQLPTDQCWIKPHHSASYRWQVYHPLSFGQRMTYGFSTEAALVAWANEAFASITPEDV